MKTQVVMVALAMTTACSASIGGDKPQDSEGLPTQPQGGAFGQDAPPSNSACRPTAARTPRPLTHLTRSFYNNTVHDLLGDTTAAADLFPLDDSLSGFEVGRDVSARQARDWIDAAERVAANAVGNLARLLPCEDQTQSCAHRFIDDFLLRAFRRPPSNDELDTFRALYAEGESNHGFVTGIQLVIQTALSSPQFLYLAERAQPEQGITSDWFMASRLSYFLTASMPDNELLAAAKAGKLRTTDDIETQVQRLLDGPGFSQSALDLARQWFGLADIGHIEKPNGALSSQAAQDLKASAFRFALDALVNKDSLDTLLLGSEVYVNDDLAKIYGVDAPGAGNWHIVQANLEERAGIFTQAGLLAKYAKGFKPDAIHRGVFIRRALLCEVLAPPPTVPPLPEGEDFSAQLKAHVANPACAGCHRLIDPVGFGFERYDGMGRYRTHDVRGNLIEVAGELVEAGDSSGPFKSVRELAERLRNSDIVADCAVRRFFRHALRQAEQDTEECAIQDASKAFRDSNGSFRALVLALARTQALRIQDATGDAP